MLRESFQYFLRDGSCLSFVIILFLDHPFPFLYAFIVVGGGVLFMLVLVSLLFITFSCMCRISFLGQDMSVPKSDIRREH